MAKYLTTKGRTGAVPILRLGRDALTAWLAGQSADVRAWVENSGFDGAAGALCPVPGAGGRLARVLLGAGAEPSMWDWAILPERLARGTFRIENSLADGEAGHAALAWTLATYAFDRYRKRERRFATLVWPDGVDRAAVERAADATVLVRDLINTPAEDMGPAELATAARRLARSQGARCRVITGPRLLSEGFPAIHAVGRAAARAPRLIDLTWGSRTQPKVTLVGKGVCFDTGGLDLKTAAGMKLMKKDMGGGAHVLGLAHMIMAAGLPVRLRVLVPAVENSVSGNALRPLDVVRTRGGPTVEIGNTDAEGRVVLADALAEAARETPQLIVDLATLTGAARIALGTELPALFSNDDDVAAALCRHGEREHDPLWRMPLWKPYAAEVEGKTADLTNAPEGGYAGAITAALFLERFVSPPAPWVHIDLMAWTLRSRPGRPEGGEAMGMRALFALIAERFRR